MLTSGKTRPDCAAKPRLGAAVRLCDALSDLRAGTSDRSRIQRDALTAFGVRIMSAGILYLSQVVLARWMGSFEYGVYVFVWTWVLLLGGLSNLGISTVMIRLLPEYRETGKLDLMRGLLRYGRWMTLAASSLVALLALGMLGLLQGRLPAHYLIPATLALACIPMVTLTDVQDGIGRGRGWMSVALLPPYVLRPVLILLAMVAAHEFGWPMSAVTATGAAVIGCWLTALVQTLLVQKRIAAELPDGPRARPSDLWLKISLPLLAITFCELLLQNTDVIVISHYLTPTDAAIYFAAAKTMSLVMFVHYAVGSAVANRLSTLNARGDQAALKSFVREAVNWTFWPSLLAALAILALGKPLLWLFGPQFAAQGYPVMFILVLGFLGRSAMGPSEFLLNMLGQQKACAVGVATTAIVNIIANILLVPHYGILGAASATAGSLVLGALINTAVAKRALGLEIAIWNNLRP